MSDQTERVVGGIETQLRGRTLTPEQADRIVRAVTIAAATTRWRAGRAFSDRPHFDVRGTTAGDTTVTVDGDPFPWPLVSVAWHVDALDAQMPAVTLRVEVGRLTVDQAFPQHDEAATEQGADDGFPVSQPSF